MTTRCDQPDDRDEQLEEIVAGYLDEVAAGQAETSEALLARHPEFATELAEFFAVRGELDAAVAPLRAAILGTEKSVLAPDRAMGEVGRLGDFRLLREVGRGGMGVVYEAEQISLGRRVALKVLPLAATLDPRQLQRFRNEALSAAALDHPHVVDVYGVGCERGTHYYAMRFVEGHSLAEVIDQLRRIGETGSRPLPNSVSSAFAGELPLHPDVSHADPAAETRSATLAAPTPRSPFSPPYFRSAAELGLRVAEALEHAHRQGVVHRDIKPSNLLLDHQGKVWVADFGLARFEAAASLTGTGAVVGTLRYMAPEQAVGRPGDHRGDIYGLGATLYELLTLRPAFPGGDRGELLRLVSSTEPPPPRQLNRSVPADLETVVLKSMAKDPDERYPTAQAFADDLRRFVEDRPILARRPGVVLRLRRWARRHRAAVTAAATGATALLVLAMVGLAASHRAVTRERDQTRAAEEQGRHRLYQVLVAQARASRFTHQVGQRSESWKAVTEAARMARELGLGEEQLFELRSEAIASLTLADLRLVGGPRERSLAGHVEFDADLKRYARGSLAGVVTVHSADDDRELAQLPGPGPATLTFSPDGVYLAVQHESGFLLWDWQNNVAVIPETRIRIEDYSVAFSPDGRMLAVGQPDGTLITYELPGGTERMRLSLGKSPMHLAFDPGGNRLAVSTRAAGREVQVRDAATGDLIHSLKHPESLWRLAWHEDGRLLAAACDDNHVHVWDAATGRRLHQLQGHQTAPQRVSFVPGSDLLLSWAWDDTTRLWNPWTGQEVLRIAGTGSQASRDGRRLVAQAGRDVTMWEVTPGREYLTLPRGQSSGAVAYQGGDISPDGRWLVLGTHRGLRLWDLAAGKELAFLEGSRVSDARFHPREAALFTCGPTGLYRWPVEARAGLLRIGPPGKLPVDGNMDRIGLDKSGRTLAVTDWHTGLRVLNPEGPDGLVQEFKHPGAIWVDVSPHGDWIASSTHHGFGNKVWNRVTGEIRDLIPEERRATLTFSPDDRWLVTSTSTEVGVWAVGSWERVRQIRRQGADAPGCAAFTRDGGLLAVTLGPSAVELLDPATGRRLARLQAPDADRLSLLVFSPDGSQLITSSATGNAWVWNLRLVRERLREIDLDWERPPYRPAPRELPPVKVDVDLG